MDWLKKNLILVIGGVVSFAIIGGAGWYLFSKIQADQDVDATLIANRASLADLEAKKPFPNAENVEAAKEQVAKITNFLAKANGFFGAPIVSRKMENTEFSAMLAQTIGVLERNAQASKITIPTNYAFSFAAQRERMQFDTNTMTKVVAQIEDVRTMTEILFSAQIYELIAIQRAPVTLDDTNAMSTHASDYLALKRIATTEFATIYPYVATIRCSTPELAAVLEGLARAQYGFFVKWIKVEPGEVQTEGEEVASVYTGGGGGGGISPSMRRRYGLGGGPRPEATPGVVDPAVLASKKVGVILKQKPLKVMIMIDVIKGLAPARNP